MYRVPQARGAGNSDFVGCNDSPPYHLRVKQPFADIDVWPVDERAFLRARRWVFENGLADERQVLGTMQQMREKLHRAGVSWRLIQAARTRLRLGDKLNRELTWPQRVAWLEAMEELLDRAQRRGGPSRRPGQEPLIET
jgi:hypothetical protein